MLNAKIKVEKLSIFRFTSFLFLCINKMVFITTTPSTPLNNIKYATLHIFLNVEIMTLLNVVLTIRLHNTKNHNVE